MKNEFEEGRESNSKKDGVFKAENELDGGTFCHGSLISIPNSEARNDLRVVLFEDALPVGEREKSKKRCDSYFKKPCYHWRSFHVVYSILNS